MVFWSSLFFDSTKQLLKAEKPRPMVCEHFWYMDITHAKSKMYKYKFKRIKYRWSIKQFKMSHYDDFHAIFSKYSWLMGHRKNK